jgi:hypothetical protein
MTTQTVNIDAFGYTGTFSAKLRNPDTIATVVATADTVVASGTIASRFVCTFGEVAVIPAGEYLLEFVVNGTSYILYVTLTGVDGEVALAVTERAMLQILEDTETTLPGLIEGIDVGLTGPFTRTITVTDTDTNDPIEGARVRLFRTGETETVETDASGVASFTVAAATWSYAIIASGYTGVSGTIAVSANGDTAVEMEANVSASPTAPDGCVIQVLCLNGVTAQQGVVIQYRAASIPAGDMNRAFIGTTQTATSNSSGIATFEVPQGSGFEWKRGDVVDWSAETAPQAETMNVRSIIGAAR